jgi:hypothetical protein
MLVIENDSAKDTDCVLHQFPLTCLACCNFSLGLIILGMIVYVYTGQKQEEMEEFGVSVDFAWAREIRSLLILPMIFLSFLLLVYALFFFGQTYQKPSLIIIWIFLDFMLLVLSVVFSCLGLSKVSTKNDPSVIKRLVVASIVLAIFVGINLTILCMSCRFIYIKDKLRRARRKKMIEKRKAQKKASKQKSGGKS